MGIVVLQEIPEKCHVFLVIETFPEASVIFTFLND